MQVIVQQRASQNLSQIPTVYTIFVENVDNALTIWQVFMVGYTKATDDLRNTLSFQKISHWLEQLLLLRGVWSTHHLCTRL